MCVHIRHVKCDKSTYYSEVNPHFAVDYNQVNLVNALMYAIHYDAYSHHAWKLHDLVCEHKLHMCYTFFHDNFGKNNKQIKR